MKDALLLKIWMTLKNGWFPQSYLVIMLTNYLIFSKHFLYILFIPSLIVLLASTMWISELRLLSVGSQSHSGILWATVVFLCRAEAAHTWSDERDGAFEEKVRAPRVWEIQSCPAERPVQHWEVQDHDSFGSERLAGTFIDIYTCI